MSEIFQYYLSEQYMLSDYDVYCGRGIRCLQHMGNQRYRSLIESMKDRYVSAGSKQDKMDIITEVIQLIRAQGGSFLRQDIANDRYYEIGDRLAREKISQSFRDAIRVMNRQANGEESANIDSLFISLTTEGGWYGEFSKRHNSMANRYYSGNNVDALFNEVSGWNISCYRRD